MKTINIKGKEYIPVNERLKHFRNSEEFKGYRINEEVIDLTDKEGVFKATIFDNEGNPISAAHAQEYRDNGYINKTSFVENGFTSALGRALGYLGIGIDASIASSDEVQTAIHNQPKQIEWTEKILNQTKGKIITGQTTLADVKKKVIVPEEIETKLLEVIS